MNQNAKDHQTESAQLKDRYVFTLVQSALWPLVLLIIFIFSGMFTYEGQYDTDEGINLIKGYLHYQGYDLYTEIWSDQPPLSTLAISQWFEWFGVDISMVRVLFFISTAVLLISFYMILVKNEQVTTAMVGVGLLILSPYFFPLSVSIMIGMPAIAFALVSVMILYRMDWAPSEENQRFFENALRYKGLSFNLILSGIFMGVASQVKLFVVILLPAVALFFISKIFVSSERDFKKNLWLLIRFGLQWAIPFLLAFCLVELLAGSFRFDMTFLSHFESGNSGGSEPTSVDQQYGISNFGATFYNLPYFLIALLGINELRRSSALRQEVVPIGWAAGSIIFIYFHSPTWYHHLVMLNVPFVWLGTFWIGSYIKELSRLKGNEAQSKPKRSLLRDLSSIVALFLLLLFPTSISNRIIQENSFENLLNADQKILSQIESNSDPDAFFFTDYPIYAVRADRAIPPELAVLTLKRFNNGNISQSEIVDVLNRYQPEYVLLERHLDLYAETVYDHLEIYYVPLYDEENFKLYQIRSETVSHSD
ncbi:MAG: phospholipid carrier-dependent glycosyltransferase [Chloroflexota bacterium]